MHNAPNKEVSTCPNTTLKQAIQQKIVRQSNRLNIIKNVALFNEQTPQGPQQELKVLQAIELYQSKKESGYMCYEGWVNINLHLFCQVGSETVSNFWKIIRLINYGEVNIPTGLIFQIFVYLTSKRAKGKNNLASLKSVINSFLSLNQKNDFLNNFRQLSNYPTLDSVENEYCPQRKNEKKEAKNKGDSKLHQRLFKEGRIREYSLQKLKYDSMVNQLKECQFTPQISNYNPREQLKKPLRTCHHQQKGSIQQDFNHNFIARQIDKKIFQGKVEQMRGVKEHIKRVVASEAERRRVQRYLNKPWTKVR